MFRKNENLRMQPRRCGMRATHSLLIGLIMLGSLVLAPFSASAEFYGDFYIGGAFTSDEDTDLKPNGLPVSAKDLQFDSSFTLGGRAGYWFGEILMPGVDYGAGLDIFYFSPDVAFQIGLTTVGPGLIVPVDVSVVGIGFDLIRFRLPLQKSATFPHGRLQPYVSLGPVVTIVTLEDSINFSPALQEETDASVGVKLSLGTTFMLNKKVGLFGEYRFTHTSAEVEFLDLGTPGIVTVGPDLNTHHLIVGATLAF